MGLFKVSNWIGGLILVAVLGGLAVTNPERDEYETYAAAKLSDYLETTVCADLPSAVAELFQSQCASLLQSGQSPLRELVSQQTAQTNFIIFSLYRTRLTIPGFTQAPAYEFETLGIGDRFFTFRAERT
ncbi:DUF4359 domain-containing protein [Romeria aff. gracilis LEGE 07310]|uniref:DUF4359 domain-containing protein n=1 Tax=Vasconcelosia minhoensis LEGE 07310 TaxID=915328 RepID=A0A8J7A759_9CYAN|nr:DUF4359 domain-containing protein [Romeria gracilis]MBE9078137.1 DUF4359 domain-containing protein [Romeria aff. gracilis LEGE 07310]